MTRTFAIVDCNNFYASCERLFRPDLKNVPLVVLSNNDGCVVARSQEVKDLGIKMAVPVFKIQDEIKRHGIQVFLFQLHSLWRHLFAGHADARTVQPSC